MLTQFWFCPEPSARRWPNYTVSGTRLLPMQLQRCVGIGVTISDGVATGNTIDQSLPLIASMIADINALINITILEDEYPLTHWLFYFPHINRCGRRNANFSGSASSDHPDGSIRLRCFILWESVAICALTKSMFMAAFNYSSVEDHGTGSLLQRQFLSRTFT